jgi:hypothetical protein
MKFWVKFSKIIFKIVASSWLKKIQGKSIEAVLKRSINMLEPEMLDEMRCFVREKLTSQGGFADRAGNCDLYYSLFGCFIAEALSMPEVNNDLRSYVKKTVQETNLNGVNLYCGAILYAKLQGIDLFAEKLRNQVISVLRKSDLQQPEYANFLGIMALYYLEDFIGIKRMIGRYNSDLLPESAPCPVVGASMVLLKLAGKTVPANRGKLNSYYRFKGGFAAFRQAPAEDLLSTAVALYALQFTNSDIRLIKPECMSFIDRLYHDGGFRAMESDMETDVEYTFYGLLGLGALG